MKIHETIRVGYSSLNDQWKKTKNVQTDITGEATAQYFGMCFFVQVLKNKDHQLHKDIIKDLESCLDANQLASKCQWFQDRVGPSPMSTTLFGNSFRSGNRRNEPKRGRNRKPKGAKGRKRDSSCESNDESNLHRHAEHSEERQHDENKDKRRPKRHGRYKGNGDEDKSDSHANVCQSLNVSEQAAPIADESIFTSAYFQ